MAEKEVMSPKYIITTAELGKAIGQSTRSIARSFREELINLPGGRLGIPSRLVKQVLEPMGVDYSFKVLAHINMRGGIGKTISTISTATRAVQYGFRTCILDLDPQASASLAFDKLPQDDDPIFYDVWQHPADMVMESLRKIQENLYILPSLLDNVLLENSLHDRADQKVAVSGVCKELDNNGFDLVIIDCPPSLGTAVISTICAADLIVIPVASDVFSFRGLDMTLSEIQAICHAFSIDEPDIGALFVKYTRSEKLSRLALERLEREYRDFCLPVVIRTSTAFAKALERKETIFVNARRSTARDDYDEYVRYILGMQDILLKRGKTNAGKN